MNATSTPTAEPDEAPVYEASEEVGTGSLFERIARVQATVRNMPKNKTATIQMKNGGQYSFDYIDKGALEAEARALFSPEGVAILISEETIAQSSNRCIVTVSITLACGARRQGAAGTAVQSAEQFTIKRSGYGNSDDDKGPAKAGTTAVRLALADLLLQGGDDVAEHDYVEYRQSVPGQALQDGERPATVQQLKFAADLVMKAHLDKAMPTAQHAILRLARAVCQREIGPGLEVEDAIRLIPSVAISKVIEKIEVVTPQTAKMVWDRIAQWEVENGYPSSVDPEATKIAEQGDVAPLLNDKGEEIPF